MDEKQLGNLYRKLNQYPYTEDYDAIIKYLEKGVAPNKQFENRYKDFEIDDNEIHYKKNGLKDLLVIKNEEQKEEKLKELYNDFSTGLGRGIKSFYKIIASKYLGITRADVKTFLEKQIPYQLTKAIIKPKNPTKKYRTANKVWYMDLIDLQKFSRNNENFKYILSVIDACTHICWLRGLKSKEPAKVLEKFKTFCDPSDLAKSCKMLVTDNGTEMKGEFDEWLKKNNIKHETSKTYTPVPLIENLNGKIRKMLQDIFTRTGNFTWHTHIKQIEDNLNNYQTLPRVKKELDIQNENAPNNLQPPEPKFKVGDYVRIAETAISSFGRKAYKEKNQKSVIIKYSVDVFKISKVFNRAMVGEFHKYGLQTTDDTNVMNTDKTISRFRECDLMLVPPPETHKGDILTQGQVNKLNQYV